MNSQFKQPVKVVKFVLAVACMLVISGCGDSQGGAAVSADATPVETSNAGPAIIAPVSSPNATSEASTGRSESSPAEQVQVTPPSVATPTPAPISNPPVEPPPIVAEEPAPVVQPEPVIEPVVAETIPVVVRPEDAPYQGTFNLETPNNNLQLIEGDETGLLFSISITRQGGHNRPVDIALAQTGAVADLQLSITQSSVGLNENSAIVGATLPVAMAPRSVEVKDIVITATDGFRQQSMTVAVTTQPVPAPDIYLLIGQSNMEGTSENGGKISTPGGPDEVNPRIQQLNVLQNSESLFTTPEHFRDPGFNVASPTFVNAEDPLHEPLFPGRNIKEGTRIGAGLSFAKAMLDSTDQNVVLVPAAWSASGFCRSENPLLGWNTTSGKGADFGTTLLLERALARLNMTLLESGGIFRGVLWHQGEADSNNDACSNGYRENLSSLIRYIRSNARPDRRGSSARGDNADIPFVIGTMSRGDDARGMFSIFSAEKQRVDDVHRTLQDSMNHVTHVSVDDLIPPAFPCGESSCVHFGSQAYREMGFRMHLGMKRLQNVQ